MATIKDVARMAGVSMATVSKYLNGGNVRPENLESIRGAIEALDYRVNPFARSLKTQRSRSIGILMPEITAPFFGSVIMALDRAFREQGYHTLISCYASNHGLERDNLSYLISHGIDGLVYVPEDLSAEEFYELTANWNIPVVQLDRAISGVKSDTVLVDNAHIMHKAVSQLIRQGHRRIAIITGPKSVFSAKERQVGYLRALSDHDILYDDTLFISDENSFITGYRGCKTLMELEDKPTAIITTNYNISLGLITAAREQGGDLLEGVKIFGFDCTDICTMLSPPLPVIQQPEALIGQTAAQYLIQRLEGYTGEPRMTRLKCKIII